MKFADTTRQLEVSNLGNVPSLLDVRLLEAQSLLLVDDAEHETEQECCNAQASQHDERSCVVELSWVSNIGICLVQNLPDKQGEEPKTDVLNPEDKCVGRTYHLGIHQLRNAWPKACGHQREAGTQHKDSDIGNRDTSHG